MPSVQTIEDPDSLSRSFLTEEKGQQANPKWCNQEQCIIISHLHVLCASFSMRNRASTMSALKSAFQKFWNSYWDILLLSLIQRIRQTKVFMTSPLPLLIFLKYVWVIYNQINITPYHDTGKFYCRFKNIL